MTEDDFRDKMMKLIKEYNDSHDNKFDIYVSAWNRPDDKVLFFGFGCKACHMEMIANAYDMSDIQHNNEEIRH